MINRTPFRAAILAINCLAACSASGPEGPPATSTLFAQPWNSGLSRQEPMFQTQSIDSDTFVIRQLINATFEAPFLYLIFGEEKALLIDTGVQAAGLRAEVDRLIAAWLSANDREAISLVVMHSHGHGDHVGGDAGFAGRPDTVVVGHTAEDVAALFGFGVWPDETAAFDLGGRVVDVVPTPGHHPSHVMVFDRATGIMFSGDAIYPGRLYFQCGKLREHRASIDRIADFAETHNVRWFLGGHIEMQSTPGRTFQTDDRARRGEHALELPGAIILEIQQALAAMGERPRVESHNDFVLFPHPPNPRGLEPPDWCLTTNGAG